MELLQYNIQVTFDLIPCFTAIVSSRAEGNPLDVRYHPGVNSGKGGEEGEEEEEGGECGRKWMLVGEVKGDG